MVVLLSSCVHLLVPSVEEIILLNLNFYLLSTLESYFIVGMQSNNDGIVISRRRVSHFHGISVGIFSLSLTFEFSKGYVISEEILLCKMGRQFNIEHLVFVNSVEIIIADEEVFWKNLLNYHFAF